MRSKIRSRVVVPKDLARESLDHTQFSTTDYIGVAIRHWLGGLSLFEEKEKKLLAQQQKIEMQQIDDLKASLLDSIYNNLVRDKNTEIVLAVNRAHYKYLNRVLDESDFYPFHVERLEEDADVLASFPALPEFNVIFTFLNELNINFPPL